MQTVKSSLYYMKSVAIAGFGEVPDGTRWVPNTDVYVIDGALVVMVELAGIRREQLEIAVEGARVIISGKRPDCCRGPNCSFLKMEINFGHFETIVELPAGYDAAKAKASYQNGFLRVEVPPASDEEAVGRDVPITGLEH